MTGANDVLTLDTRRPQQDLAAEGQVRLRGFRVTLLPSGGADVEQLTWSAVLAFGLLQLTGTAIRRFHQTLTSADPFVHPIGWSNSGKLALTLLRLASFLVIAALVVRAGLAVGWGFAAALFLAGLIASIAIEFLLTLVAIRLFRLAPQVVTSLLAVAGFLTVPVLGMLIWLWIPNE